MINLDIKPIKSVLEERAKTIVKKKKEYKVKPTEKQKLAFKNLTEKHCSEKEALISAGFSEGTAQKPKNVTNTKGWQQLLDEYLPDEDLAKAHKEGMLAIKTERGIDEEGNIKYFIPDYAVRHKYLDTAYKLKRMYSEDKLNELTIEEAMLKNLKERRKKIEEDES